MDATWLFLGAVVAFLLSIIANWMPKPSWLRPIHIFLIAAILVAAGVFTDIKSSESSAKPSPAVASPFTTSLPVGSPLRNHMLNVDQLCFDLGLSSYAWLPGQRSATDLNN